MNTDHFEKAQQKAQKEVKQPIEKKVDFPMAGKKRARPAGSQAGRAPLAKSERPSPQRTERNAI